jgi:hypothetical protein
MTWRWEWIIHLANKHHWTRGAELGVRKGATFLKTLAACPQLTLIGVDLWANQPDGPGPQRTDHADCELQVRQSAQRFGPRAVLLKDWTHRAVTQVPDGSLDFVFIDADHSTEGVRRDIQGWTPKLKPGGCMMGHDINWPEVRAAVDAMCAEYIIGPDNCWCAV